MERRGEERKNFPEIFPARQSLGLARLGKAAGK